MKKLLVVMSTLLMVMNINTVCIDVHAEDDEVSEREYEEKAKAVLEMEEAKAREYEEEVSLAKEKLVSVNTKTYWMDNGIGNRFFYDSNGNQFGTGNNLRVIDVSEHQGKIDWKKLKESGKVDAAIIRCGYWSNYTDKYFSYNIQQCNELGIPYGIYLFSYANLAKEGTDEAKWTVELLKKYNCKPTLPVYYDLESWTYINGAEKSPSKPMTYEAIVNNYMTVMNDNGINAQVYSYQYYLNTALKSDKIWKYVSWVAAYTNTLGFVNTVYPYQTSLYGWQYSSSESIPGVTGKCDVSAFANAGMLAAAPKVYTTAIDTQTAGFKVKWTPVENAVNYAVYRRIVGGEFVNIANVNTNSYLDTTVKSGNKYQYFVKAEVVTTETVEKEVESEETEEVTVVTEEVEVTKTIQTISATKLFLATPTVKLSKSGSKKIKVKWNKITGATGYIIYRKTGSGSYKKIKTITKNTTTSYTNKSLKKGKKYYYYVKAYKGTTYSAYKAVSKKI